MKYRLKKVAVLGSGVMGSGIACHLANIGMEVLMLDIIPPNLEGDQLKNQKISVLIDCGVDDFLIETNRQMHSLLMEKKIPHEYIERPGAHTWNYWTDALPVQFFFLTKSLKR